MPHTIQQIEKDKDGIVRFRENKIVAYLLDNGGIDMNNLAVIDFSDEDREQFAQLIGYSLSGFGELSYVSNETYDTAVSIIEIGESEQAARIKVLTETLDNVKVAIGAAAVQLFDIHPDDLT